MQVTTGDEATGAAMIRPGAGSPQWTMVDEGWGRKAVDFATLSEPGPSPGRTRRDYGVGSPEDFTWSPTWPANP